MKGNVLLWKQSKNDSGFWGGVNRERKPNTHSIETKKRTGITTALKFDTKNLC
jgi:hypothetical protein